MKPLRVLIVEDEPVICDGCRLVLGERGYRVEICRTGKQGLLALEREAYDVLLLDLKLPDLDGMEILKILRQEKPGLPVIIMTGYSTTSSAVEAMKLGAADYLAKPFSDDELLEALEKSCGPPEPHSTRAGAPHEKPKR